jgi:hypothetical protein
MRIDPRMELSAQDAAGLQDARAAAVDQFFGPDTRRANVVGVGIGKKWTNGQPTDTPAVVVLVTQKVPEAALARADRIQKKVPKSEVVTDVHAVGPLFIEQRRPPAPDPHYQVVEGTIQPHYQLVQGTIQPHYQDVDCAKVQALTRRVRPAKGGYSVGHVDITAGTIATCVYDILPDGTVTPPANGSGIPSRYYILSNNHVLANTNAASIGDPILQPGPFDGGTNPADRIATLSRYIPITLEPDVPRGDHDNLVDAAVAEADFNDIDREVYWIGRVRAWRPSADVTVGTVVQKTGRTTHYTLGRITTVSATVDVGYGGGRVARFRDQILMTNMSAPGDSGSLISTTDGVAVGLLFAGSPQATIASQIENVRALLRVEVAETTA